MVPYLALLICQCLFTTTFAMVNPFIPLYLSELGEDTAAVVLWTGAIFGIGNVVQIVAFPV
jgi:hypothetical protein